MKERLYSGFPGLYDALYERYRDYPMEVDFFEEQFVLNRRADGDRVLIVGCGPGRHAEEFRTRGYDVLAVDKHRAMVGYARRRSGVPVVVGMLPDLPVDGAFDLILLPYNVINYLDGAALEAGLRSVTSLLESGGVLILDNQRFPAETGPPLLETFDTADGEYARLSQLHVGPSRAVLNALLVVPDGELAIDTHELVPHDDGRVADLLSDLGYLLETYDGGYGLSMPGDRFSLTVFVATR